MATYTIDPRTVPRWRLRNPGRVRSAQLAEMAWTGTDEQRAVTTTDPAEFVEFPERFTYFHDRQRGQVFVRDWRSPAERYAAGEDPTKPPPILPHRYMRGLDQDDVRAAHTSLLQRFRAAVKQAPRWQPKRKGLD